MKLPAGIVEKSIPFPPPCTESVWGYSGIYTGLRIERKTKEKLNLLLEYSKYNRLYFWTLSYITGNIWYFNPPFPDILRGYSGIPNPSPDILRGVLSLKLTRSVFYKGRVNFIARYRARVSGRRESSHGFWKSSLWFTNSFLKKE